MTKLALIGSLWAACLSVQAMPVLSIQPAQQSVTLGNWVSVELRISGLNQAAALSTYDLQIGFDASLLGYADTTFGNQLDVLGNGSIQNAQAAAGTLTLWEISLDGATDLLALQADEFRLATIAFQTLSTGFSPLTLSINALGDAAGDSLAAQWANAGITVAAVPLPAVGWSLLLPLLASRIGTGARRSKSGRAR